MNPDNPHPTSPSGGRAWRRVSVGIGIGGIVVAAVAGWWYGLFTKSTTAPDERRAVVLNRLRDEINAHYGCDENGDPFVNCGPCGRFAREFREQWNARFNEKVNIVFQMSPDGSHCGHILVKFPDGSYFDGGRGVMSEQKMLTFNRGARLEEMVDFDLNLLDKRCDYLLNRRCDGLDFVYPGCPRYRDDLTAQLIKKHLEMLSQGVD